MRVRMSRVRFGKDVYFLFVLVFLATRAAERKQKEEDSKGEASQGIGQRTEER
jgi:hypothetical protein